MNKKDLLFYDAYEAFYAMANKSVAFQAFCKDAFGADFSQDGFSNIEQIDMILQYIPHKDNVHILDIGCGNGKMLDYLQKKTDAHIYGFDYSEEAINTAQLLFPKNSEFKVGIIGKIDYPEETFDVIISMDTMYFAKDMTVFVAQIKKWLKKNGLFFVGYQEGDVIPKTESIHTTMLSKALLIVCGEKDAANKKTSKELCHYLNNSYFYELMKTGHEANIEAPEELANMLQRFYDDIR